MKITNCPECNGEIIKDDEDIYCKKCGLVIEENGAHSGIAIEGVQPE